MLQRLRPAEPAAAEIPPAPNGADRTNPVEDDDREGGTHRPRLRAVFNSGDSPYESALRLNQRLNAWRARLGLPYWSLSQYLKHRVKSAVGFITRYEQALAAEARRRGLDGVVCGPIHKPEMHHMDGVL